MSIRETSMPRPTQAFVEFAQLLRASGFSVSPDQTTGFVEAIGLLGPRNIGDIRNSGIAMLSIPRQRRDEYDAHFNAFFLGQRSPSQAVDTDDEETQAHDADSGTRDVDVDGDEDDGRETSRGELLSYREFRRRDKSGLLRGFERALPGKLPVRRSSRWRVSRLGKSIDRRTSMRRALRREGEIFDLMRRNPKRRQRPLVLLIDVSGSMKERSDDFMRLAHVVVQAADRAEVFSFGTRLTRLTSVLAVRDQDQALKDVAGLVADFDGGTRIGDALQALLSVPRFAAKLRGASVVVLSDGLERDDPSAMIDAVARISRMAWRQDWLSPLAGSGSFTPRTQALRAALPHMTSLGGGEDLQAVADHILSLSRRPTGRRAA